LAVVFQFQGSHPVEYQLELLEVYYRLGVRMIQLTYNHRSPVGDGCEEPNDAGLSRFGAAVVQEMNRLGMVIDLSHTGRRTTLDAIQVSDQPCVFSHSNVNGVHPNGRNIDDDQVRALAEKGGVIGVNAFPPFVSGDREPTVDQLVDHVDYIVQLVGDRHVSIGLDYYTRNLPMKVYEDNIRTGRWKRENYSPPPWRYAVEDPTRIPEITCRLVQRGYPAESIHRIMGANLLGLFETVWR
jgi:membrane dipeptidase